MCGVDGLVSGVQCKLVPAACVSVQMWQYVTACGANWEALLMIYARRKHNVITTETLKLIWNQSCFSAIYMAQWSAIFFKFGHYISKNALLFSSCDLNSSRWLFELVFINKLFSYNIAHSVLWLIECSKQFSTLPSSNALIIFWLIF